MPSKRTTIYLDDRDRRALRRLQDRYGMASLSDVIRFAVRTLAAEQHQNGEVPQDPPLPDFRSTGSESLQHSPGLFTPTLPMRSNAAAGSALAPPDEQTAILIEQLRGT